MSLLRSRLSAVAATLIGLSPAFGYVTSDGVGTHVTTPGVPAFGVNVDGVAELFVDNNAAVNAGGLGSGALLWTGSHILTAAHVVTNSLGVKNIIDGADGNFAFFDLPGGGGFVSYGSSDVYVHPLWNGDVSDGYDIAIIDVGPVVSAVPRYNLFTDYGNEFGRTTVKVGYGRSGVGSAGASTPAGGTKRAGLNEWELTADTFWGATNTNTQLMYDFDSGATANDAFGFFYGTTGPFSGGNAAFNDLGFGNDEVGASNGDSGGPSFIFDGGQWKIAGVTSYGFSPVAFDQFGGSYTSDVVSGTNSSFGEFVVDARIANPNILGWINTVIPEPTAAALLGAGVLALFARRRGA